MRGKLRLGCFFFPGKDEEGKEQEAKERELNELKEVKNTRLVFIDPDENSSLSPPFFVESPPRFTLFSPPGEIQQHYF